MLPLRVTAAALSLAFAPACFDPTESLTGSGSNDGPTTSDAVSDGDSTTATTAEPATTDPAQETSATADGGDSSSRTDDGSSGDVTAAVDSSGDATSGDATSGDATSGDATIAEASTTAEAPTCGDGIIEGDELCDDGNGDDDDGCTTCVVDAGQLCTGEPSLCGATCDPLLQDCGEPVGCYAAPEGWMCLADTSGVGGLEDQPCETLTDCNPGLVCLDVASVPDCVSDACCTPVCDMTDPMGCGGGLECVVLAVLPVGDDAGICLPTR